MKFFLLASVVASALAIAPPRIELSLDGEPYKLNYGITRVHHDNTKTGLGSRQDYTLKCAANQGASSVSMRSSGTEDCKFPHATAFDHYEKDITDRIEYKMWVGNDNNQKYDCPDVDSCEVDLSARGTYLFLYDVSDSHNNHADQIVFALVVDDMEPPVISPNGCTGRKIEAGPKPTGFSACGDLGVATATDNIDDAVDLHYSLRYKSFDDDSTWTPRVENSTLAQVDEEIDTLNQGYYELAMYAHDNAGIYGHEGKNNEAFHTTVFVVNDTLPPTISIHGYDPDYHECGVNYADGGANATDTLDTALSRPITVAISGEDFDTSAIGENTLTYTASDQKGNEAQAKTRQVAVVDTTPPTISLKGPPRLIHYASNDLEPEDEGVEVTENCGSYTVETSWRGENFNNTKLGEYVRVYTAKDDSNNTAEVSRTFVNIDVTKPVIDVEGHPELHLNSSVTEVYEDAGATCHDWVDHELSHAVEVSGDVVDLAKGGTYTIVYNCQDLSGNRAEQMERKVIVADKQCPVITLKGARVNFIEPNFPYVDAGATASDDVDGDITDRIVTDGDTVNVAEAFFTRRNCQEIKTKASAVSADHVASGEYMVTRYVNNNVKERVLVWCDMTESPARTYYAVVGGERVQPYGTTRGSCADVGMWMVQDPENSMHSLAKSKFETDFPGTQFLSTSADHLATDGTTDTYICDAHQDPTDLDEVATGAGGAHITFTGDKMTKINWKDGAEAGKYIIEYRVMDRSNNTQCDIKYRTVLVRSDIPDVEDTLHVNVMAENTNTQSGWFIGAIVSAITGLSLLALTSSRKQQSLAVPV